MRRIKKVYIASPLFNLSERKENEKIDRILRKAGFDTFLPQRDGFLFVELVEEIQRQGSTHPEAEAIALSLITHLDIFQVCERCDATVLNLNGRVPDEGGVSEAAMAFRGELPLVLFKNDSRSPMHGKDNPLVVGLTGFEIARSIAEIPVKLKELERQEESSYSRVMRLSRVLFAEYDPKDKNIPRLVERGKELLS